MLQVPDIATLPAQTGVCEVTVATIPTATDNVDGLILGTTNDPLTYDTKGTFTINWSYQDSSGNISTQQQTVVVDDSTIPEPDLLVLPTITGNCSVTVGTTPTATDNCAGSILATTSDPLSYSTPGTYTITWNYDDGNGNTNTQVQTVQVDGTTPVPDVASLPTVTGTCSVSVPATPTATDGCTGATISATTSDPLSYSTPGTYTVTWNYDDGNGNTNTQSQMVQVDDASPIPDLANLPTVTGTCSASVSTTPTASDGCTGTSISATTTDPLSYSTPGTYTITWNFDDGNGNTSSQTQNIQVLADIVFDSVTLSNAVDTCQTTVTSVPTATNLCTGSTIIGTTTDSLTYDVPGTLYCHLEL